MPQLTVPEHAYPQLPLEKGFGIHFRLDEPDLFEPLVGLFEALKEAKASGDLGDASEWKARLHPDVCARLFVLAEEERTTRHELTSSNVVLITPPREALGSRWDFGDILDCLDSGEYDLLEIVRRLDGSAELLIDPHAYPYGGIGCLMGLVDAHGMHVLGFVEYGKYEALVESCPSHGVTRRSRKWWEIWK